MADLNDGRLVDNSAKWLRVGLNECWIEAVKKDTMVVNLIEEMNLNKTECEKDSSSQHPKIWDRGIVFVEQMLLLRVVQQTNYFFS